MEKIMNIGCYAMLDALRMIPETWTRDAEIGVTERGTLRIVRRDWVFELLGDGVVSVTRGEDQEIFDDHGQATPGEKFMETVVRLFEKKMRTREAYARAKDAQHVAHEHIQALHDAGIIEDAEWGRMMERTGAPYIRDLYHKYLREEG